MRRTQISMIAALWALVVLLVGPGVPAALAHARFEGADPAPGATVDAAPNAVTIWYTEAIDLRESWIRVFDPSGVRVDLEDSAIPADNLKALTVHLRPNLPAGVYVVTWQNLSEDGDGPNGSFRFGIGTGTPSSSGEDDHEAHHEESEYQHTNRSHGH
jgi:methionine-rich copper-binding protein CopC